MPCSGREGLECSTSNHGLSEADVARQCDNDLDRSANRHDTKYVGRKESRYDEIAQQPKEKVMDPTGESPGAGVQSALFQRTRSRSHREGLVVGDKVS